MSIPVHYLHKNELVYLLEEEKLKFATDSKDSRYPFLARLYREKIKGDEDELVEYDRASKLYQYDFNGKTFKGTDDELISFLKSKDDSHVMTWEHSGEYYIAFENNVLKTNDKGVYERKISQIMQMSNIESEEFLVIRDLNKKSFDIWLPPFDILITSQKEKFLNALKQTLVIDSEFVLEKKCNVKFKEIESELNGVSQPYIPMIQYKNLSRKEYVAAFTKIKKFMEQTKSNIRRKK